MRRSVLDEPSAEFRELCDRAVMDKAFADDPAAAEKEHYGEKETVIATYDEMADLEQQLVALGKKLDRVLKAKRSPLQDDEEGDGNYYAVDGDDDAGDTSESDDDNEGEGDGNYLDDSD